MNNDREQLELAAKAAGIKGWWSGDDYCYAYKENLNVPVPWNPLTDDGDALRLAVKLGIHYRLYDNYISASFGNGEVFCEEFNDAPYAATRRAIVRAAAEIGRAM